jgi:hypothetical protein
MFRHIIENCLLSRRFGVAHSRSGFVRVTVVTSGREPTSHARNNPPHPPPPELAGTSNVKRRYPWRGIHFGTDFRFLLNVIFSLFKVCLEVRFPQIYQKSECCVRTVGARRFICSKFRTEDTKYYGSPYQVQSPDITSSTLMLFVHIL